MNRTLQTTLSLILVAALFTACLPEEPPVPKRISVRYQVTGLDSEITRGDDAITLDEVKLVLDKFNLQTGSDATLETNPDVIVLHYNDNSGLDETVLQNNIGYDDFSRFRAIRLFVAEPKEDDVVQDADLKTINDSWSTVIKGTYNGNSFTFKSKLTFDKLYEFEEVAELTADKETLLIRILTNVENWVVDAQTDQILDPTRSENTSAINANIEASLEVEGSAVTTLPFGQ